MACFVLHLFPIIEVIISLRYINVLQISWTPNAILDDFLQVKTEGQFTHYY